jgi:DNA-binding transcriptional ArsR family regulator
VDNSTSVVLCTLPVNVRNTYARLGSVTLAAKELNVTHSAISQQIKILEELVGVKLFIRQGRGVQINDAKTGDGLETAQTCNRWIIRHLLFSAPCRLMSEIPISFIVIFLFQINIILLSGNHVFRRCR